MSASQDQPPLTRRQAREQERAKAQQLSQSSRRAGTTGPTAAGEIPPVATPFGSAPKSEQTPVEQGEREQGEPLGSTPSTRPNVPRYDGAPVDSLLAPSDDDDDDDAAPGLFRPELAPDVSEPITQPVPSVPVTSDSPEPGSDSAEPRSDSAEPVSAASAAQPAEKTLTRRELRALMQAQEANERAASGVDAPDEDGNSAKAAAMNEEPEPGQEPLGQPTEEPEDVAPIMHRGSFVMPPPASAAADTEEPGQEPASPRETEGAVPQQPQQAEPQQQQPGSPPAGHWSNVADHEQGERHSGHGGVGTTTTSALILPSIPSSGDVNRPITGTGEILVTGSIEVPHSFATSGHRPSRFDSSEIDRLFDQSEADADTGTAAPVRASRAISTHTSTRGVITPQQGHGGALPMVLGITAGVLGLGVIGLLIAGFVLRIF